MQDTLTLAVSSPQGPLGPLPSSTVRIASRHFNCYKGSLVFVTTLPVFPLLLILISYLRRRVHTYKLTCLPSTLSTFSPSSCQGECPGERPCLPPAAQALALWLCHSLWYLQPSFPNCMPPTLLETYSRESALGTVPSTTILRSPFPFSDLCDYFIFSFSSYS